MTDMNSNQPDETLGAPPQQAAPGPQQNQPQGQPPVQGEPMLGATQPTQGGPDDSSLQRDPDEWATGDEPMTLAQKSYLDTLAKEAGETLPASLTKAEASKHIDRLQAGNGRVNQQGGQAN